MAPDISLHVVQCTLDEEEVSPKIRRIFKNELQRQNKAFNRLATEESVVLQDVKEEQTAQRCADRHHISSAVLQALQQSLGQQEEQLLQQVQDLVTSGKLELTLDQKGQQVQIIHLD
jgi:hypothetical protein